MVSLEVQKIGFLFPGQGAQSVGMCRGLLDQHAIARDVFERASAILGYDLADVCLNGPESRLSATEYSQPALFVSSIAAIEVMRIEQPQILAQATVAAGLSLGEYTAVCFAGALDFESSVRLVQRRGQAMQAAADAVESGMASVLGLDVDKLTDVCRQAVEPGEVLQIANLLCPGNIAVSGHKTALARLETVAMEAGAMKVIPLSVAGAFHTPLMASAVDSLTEALAEMPIVDAKIPVVSNVDARSHTSPDEIRSLLARQVVSPVRWEESVRQMIADGTQGFFEVGAGRVLRGILRRIDRKMPAEGFGDDN
ncbi:Malonyl CoA-acyl carrier protein transacylase [Rosistilla carotiformis]|uniref:Malonyl CoA-acyl carrier protein transacylase n=1 Tax=Rosistilla carotiformis TaxID=2528017 RepID=A0A518JM60_9BACT|nr:ACP S-malonyltransferase [Rosistilla carotiformis]QDV66577.1 Malonyl CoA-acyl carrier protein transacylase [Rosistilla carotiformis]